MLCCSVAILVVTNCGATEPGNRLNDDSVSTPQEALHHRFRRHPVLGGLLLISLGDESRSASRHSKHKKGKGRKKKPNEQGLLSDVLDTKQIVIIGGDEGKEDESSKEQQHDTSSNKNLKSQGRTAENLRLPISSTDNVRQASDDSTTTVSIVEGSNSTVASSQESSIIGVTAQVLTVETTVKPDTVSTAEGSNPTVAPSEESSTIDVATQVVSLETTVAPVLVSTFEVSNSTEVSPQESSTIAVTIPVAASETTAAPDVAPTPKISDSTVAESQESSIGVTTQVVSLNPTAASDASSNPVGSNATAPELDDRSGSLTLTKSGSRSLGRDEIGSRSVAEAGKGSRYLAGNDLGFYQNFGGKTSGKFNDHSPVEFSEEASPQRPSTFPELKQKWALPKQPIYSHGSDSMQSKYSNIQTLSSQQGYPSWQNLQKQDNPFATPGRQSAYDSYMQMLSQAYDTSQGQPDFFRESLNQKPMISSSTQDKLYRPPDLDSFQKYHSPSRLSPNTSPFHQVVHHKHTYEAEDPFFG